MSTQSKAPQIIWSKENDKEYYLSGFTKFSPLSISLHYQEIGEDKKMNLSPHMVESEFLREKPRAKQNPILQGKYECAPAALAMALGERLFTVKRQMGKLNWRNDDAGVNNTLMRATARAMGRDLVEIPLNELSPILGPCILTIKSLNVPKYSHAIAWTGKELLDSNTNYSGRNYWGIDWSPDMIGAKCCHLLLERPLSEEENNQYIQFLKDGNEKKVTQIKQNNLVILPQIKNLEV